MPDIRKFQYFVNNNWYDPMDGGYLESENPANGKVWAKIPRRVKFFRVCI